MATFRWPKHPAGPNFFSKVLVSNTEVLHEFENRGHGRCVILSYAHSFFMDFQYFHWFFWIVIYFSVFSLIFMNFHRFSRFFLNFWTFSETLVDLVLWPQNFPRPGEYTKRKLQYTASFWQFLMEIHSLDLELWQFMYPNRTNSSLAFLITFAPAVE